MPVFLFNDIERSTRLWEEHPDEMGAAISRHDAILQEQISRFGGRILRHRGDGISAVFEGGEPLECAIAVQKAFASENWGPVGQVLIRVALHAGYAERREFDSATIGQKEEYFGTVLNRTARVMDAGWGGQILLTPAVVNTCALPTNAIVQDLGVHLLKDLHDPQRIYGLVHPDLPLKEFPPLRSLSSHPHNLSPQPTPFVGREEDRTKIAALLSDPACRLLTLVGPGGIGKTRLALQVAAEVIEKFPNGVYAVQLAPISSAEFLLSAITDAVKAPLYGGQNPKSVLFNYLREKSMLLVMDNFEHLLDSAGLVSEILAAAPNVKILVTSRQRLNLQGEWLYKVQGMLGSEDGQAGAASSDGAIQLFIQSAHRVQPDFTLADSDRAAVSRICELVEGMPLGIELAAAWIQVLSPKEIATEIESNLDFLVSSLKDVPERHRSLRAVFEHSWNMLSEQERIILARLSVFRGGFRHEAARQVAGVSLPMLLELVDKSLLRRMADGRYEMHEFLRQHAQEQLARMEGGAPPATSILETTEAPAPPLETTPTRPVTAPAAVAAAPASPAPAPAPAPVELKNPYKGLRAFQEDDADDFFGREALINQLVGRLQEPDPNARFLAVVGPSGSGKSSVVRAGLIPALRRGALPGSERWVVVEMLPSAYPLEELELALLRASDGKIPELLSQLRRDERGLMRAVQRILPDDPDVELVLLIDQFEELFTLVEDESARFHFLDSLMVALSDPRSRLRAVVTLRADFYDRPLRYPEFGRMMRERTEIVLPLSPDELEQAIVSPAERVGLMLGTDLVAAIVADVSEQPGQLPLLQYTLTELFERREGRALTLAAYRSVGGVSGALARRAEELFAGLDPTQQEAARQLFLRLVTPGEGTEDTRRRVRLDELGTIGDTGPGMEAVMSLYSQYRLLTFDRDPITHGPTVEVAHEALIREWKRLREWLDKSREDLRLHRRLMAAAAEWTNAGKDPGFLMTGSRLAQYEDWVSATDLGFTQDEWDYLVASLTEQEQATKQEQERLRREIELEKRSITLEKRSITFERRAASRLRYLVITLAVFLVAALGLSIFAMIQSSKANTAKSTAEFNAGVARTQVAIAQTQAGIAQLNSSLLLSASAELALANRDTDLAIMLALKASEQEAPPAQALDALFEVTDAPGTRYRMEGHSGWVNQVAFSPDGRRGLSASADTTLILWNLDTGKSLRRLEGHTDAVTSAAFSPDGARALSGSMDGTVRLWDLETGASIWTLNAQAGPVMTVAFSLDGQTAVFGGQDGLLHLIDVAGPTEIRTFTGHTDAVISAVFSADGTHLLSGSQDATLRLWDVASGQELETLAGHADAVMSAAFSPDGSLALSGSRDGTLRLWDLGSGTEIHRFEGHTGAVMSVAFSPDGSLALSSSRDNSIRLWDLESQQETLRLLGHTGVVSSAAISPNGRRILSGSYDMTLRLWDVTRGSEIERLMGHTDAVYSVAVSPDGKTALSGSGDNRLLLWDLETGEVLRTFEGHTDWVRGVAFSPDGTTALSGSYDKTVILWDVASGQMIRRFEGHTDRVRAIALSPDGTLAASSGDDGLIIVWDVATGQEVRRMDNQGISVRAVAFSPDSKTLVSGSQDTTVSLWDVATGNRLHTLAGHGDVVVSVAFSPDGQTVLSGALDTTMILWDAAEGREIRRYLGQSTPVYSVAFSPDGQTALSGANDGTIILWNVATGAEIRRFTGHSAAVYSIAFTPDGRRALSGSGDTSLRLWRIDSSLDDLVSWTYANRYVGQLTCEQRAQYRVDLCNDQELAMIATQTALPTLTFTPRPTSTITLTPSAEPPTATPTPTLTETPTLEPPTATLTVEPTQPATEVGMVVGSPSASPEPSVTPTPTETPSPTPVPPTATPTETQTPTPEAISAPVVLVYDPQSLTLYNRTDQSVNVGGLTFIQTTTDGQRLTFESDQWSGGSASPYSLPPQDCFQLWTNTGGGALPRPEDCPTRHAWREVGPSRWFWISTDPNATFEVRRADEILATCTVGAGQCGVNLEAGAAAPAPAAVSAAASATPAPTSSLQPTATALPATVTLTPTPTTTPAPATAEPSATPTAAAPTVSAPAATEEAAPAASSGAPVQLTYDAQTLVLYNHSDQNVDVSGLTFVQVAADGTRLSFDSNQWSGGSEPPSRLPPGDCFQVWKTEIKTSSLPRPDDCGTRHAWRQVAQGRWFWISSDPNATFEVRRADEILATCRIQDGACEVPLGATNGG